MVAPHQIGDLVRSFVRIPGSGSSKSATPGFCDLARTSTLAAAIPIPQNLPPATNVLTQTPIADNQQRKRSGPEEKENGTDFNSAPPVIRIETSSATPSIKTIPVTLMAAVRISHAGTQKLKEKKEQLRKENEKLKEKKEQLRKENEILKKQLSLFRQLIHNPQRLNSVLRRLEKKTQEVKK